MFPNKTQINKCKIKKQNVIFDFNWKSNGRMTHGSCFRCLVHVTLYCQFKNKQQTLKRTQNMIFQWLWKNWKLNWPNRARTEIKRTNFGNQKSTDLRNQTNKFWKSKTIWEIKPTDFGTQKNHSRNQTDKFWNGQDKNQNYNYLSDTPRTGPCVIRPFDFQLK